MSASSLSIVLVPQTLASRRPSEIATDHLSLRSLLSLAFRRASASTTERGPAGVPKPSQSQTVDAKTKKAIADVLKYGASNFTVEEKINILAGCLKMGSLQAMKATDKDLLIVIGNTGAGKSTFVNCEC